MAGSRWISDLHWKRTGQQSRSQKTQESLLDAAESLFFEKGAEATSVADVAERAGCSVGAVYHHFRDKKALLYALYDRMTTQYREISRDAVDPARWEGATIVDILRGYMEFALAMARERPGFKLAGLEATHNDPELRAHFAELTLETHRGQQELLLARRDEIDHPDPVRATAFVLDQITAMLRSRLDPVLRERQLTTWSDEEFMQEALRSACAYLQMGNPESRDTNS